MEVLSIFDGVTVKCNVCGIEHIVNEVSGNNLEWKDKGGWVGSYDAAHGYFESKESDAECPDCQKLNYYECEKK